MIKRTIQLSLLTLALFIGGCSVITNNYTSDKKDITFGDTGVYDYLIYNWNTGLAYFNTDVSQWLFGGTTTTTDATLEVQGGFVADQATSTKQYSTTYCINNASPDCITAWPSGGGGGLEATAFNATAPLTIATTSSSVLYGITQSGTASDGYLDSIDWNTFNNKWGYSTTTNDYWWNNTAGLTISNQITAGTGLSWSSNTLNAEVQTSDLHSAVTLAGTPNYLTLSGQEITQTVLDINDDTDLTATTPLALSVGGAMSIDTSGTWSGNAITATALAADGSNCLAGSYPLGVDASGATQSCTDASIEIDSIVATHTAISTAHQALVTVTGEDYLTLSTQAITANAIDADNLSATDFGDFTCNGTTCSLDGNVVASSEVDLTDNYTWTGVHDYSGGVLEIPNGTAPTVDATGEIALDTTDNQLIIGDDLGTARVFAFDEQRLFSTTIASTSPEFLSGGIIPIGKNIKDGRDITQFRCYVDGGTSVIMNVSDGTNDTEAITCAATVTSDTDVATNSTFTADEKWELQFGTITGAPDYLIFEAYGYVTRE